MVKRALLAALTMFALASTASANVIYDVVVTYSGGFAYRFSMEFANATGLKTELDLISSGPERDFQGEQFLKDGTPWVLDIDRNFDGLDDFVSFDPATNLLSFAYHPLGDGGDFFSIVDASFPTGRGCATVNGNGGSFSELFAGTCGGSNFIETTSTSVTLRNGAVSEPATLGLLALSLAGLLGFRGRARGKWTHKRHAA
jgi:hypothetical protein